MDNEIWLQGSPFTFVETDAIQLALVFRKGATLTIVNNYMYLGAEDKKSSILTGSGTVSNNIVTTPAMANWVGGNDYVYAIAVTVDGQTVTRKAIFQIQKVSAKKQ